MITVSLRDGSAVTLDPSLPDDLAVWQRLQALPAIITSVSVQVGAAVYRVSAPKRFKRVAYAIEAVEHRRGDGSLVGEAVTVYADNVQTRLLVHTGANRVASVELAKTGMPVYLRGQL